MLTVLIHNSECNPFGNLVGYMVMDRIPKLSITIYPAELQYIVIGAVV
jgi:hypothetical protein